MSRTPAAPPAVLIHVGLAADVGGPTAPRLQQFNARRCQWLCVRWGVRTSLWGGTKLGVANLSELICHVKSHQRRTSAGNTDAAAGLTPTSAAASTLFRKRTDQQLHAIPTAVLLMAVTAEFVPLVSGVWQQLQGQMPTDRRPAIRARSGALPAAYHVSQPR